jgi:hypothetical protein
MCTQNWNRYETNTFSFQKHLFSLICILSVLLTSCDLIKNKVHTIADICIYGDLGTHRDKSANDSNNRYKKSYFSSCREENQSSEIYRHW